MNLANVMRHRGPPAQGQPMAPNLPNLSNVMRPGPIRQGLSPGDMPQKPMPQGPTPPLAAPAGPARTAGPMMPRRV